CNDQPQARNAPMTTDYVKFTEMLMDDIRTNGRPTQGPMAGRPLMVLTTTGARTGEDREAVVTYTRDGDRYVIAASKSGAPTNPAWYHNLIANPTVTVETGGETFQATAQVTEGAKAKRLGRRNAGDRPEFGDYRPKPAQAIPS